MAKKIPSEIETDILIIGGGIAGIFAAVTARQKGFEVTLVDKGSPGNSGATPFADTFCVFDEELGHQRQDWINTVSFNGEYLNNRAWLEKMIDHSKERFQNLKDWGVLDDPKFGIMLRKHVIRSKTNVLERVMMTTLLQVEGRVIGAVGFALDDGKPVTITAKATIMCAGAGGFKPVGFPIRSLTHDGDAMAYRAGAEITGKEWIDAHGTPAANPAAGRKQFDMTSHGIFMTGQPKHGARALNIDKEIRVHQGGLPPMAGPPPYAFGALPDGTQAPPPPDMQFKKRKMIGGSSAGLAVHKAEGIFSQNNTCASNVPGLYAAGDGLGSMLCGTLYAGIGFSFCGSSVQGACAGEEASEFAATAELVPISKLKTKSIHETMFEPLERKTVITPAWVTQIMQNAVIPYYVLYVKEQSRLEAALTNIEFMRDHLAPKMIASNPHELRSVHETINMLLNAEMKLRASLFRTESRGTHYREDFPARNDDDWLAWIKIKSGAEGMKLIKHPIPDEWRPDERVPYEERYPARFPGELDYRIQQAAE